MIDPKDPEIIRINGLLYAIQTALNIFPHPAQRDQGPDGGGGTTVYPQITSPSSGTTFYVAPAPSGEVAGLSVTVKVETNNPNVTHYIFLSTFDSSGNRVPLNADGTAAPAGATNGTSAIVVFPSAFGVYWSPGQTSVTLLLPSGTISQNFVILCQAGLPSDGNPTSSVLVTLCASGAITPPSPGPAPPPVPTPPGPAPGRRKH